MKKQIFNPFLPLDKYIPDGEIQVFANGKTIARKRINPFGRKAIALVYQIVNKDKQELSIRFFGKGKFDLYSLNFKEKI